MTLLDLDELPELFDESPLARPVAPGPRVASPPDYLGDPDEPLEDSARGLVADRVGHRPEGPVRLLTHLRYLGVSFNPVSFFYHAGRGDRSRDRGGHQHSLG